MKLRIRTEEAQVCRLLQEGRCLLEKASVSGKTPSVKAAAAEALAVSAFVGSEHPSDTLEVAQHLQSLWKGDGTPLCSSLHSGKGRGKLRAFQRMCSLCNMAVDRYHQCTSLLNAFSMSSLLDARPA